jgi:hypothetical protein
MSRSNVAVIIINWKLKEETLACIRSVEQSIYPCRIIIVDNGSDDGSVEYFQEYVPHIELISLPTNIGFGRACNHAIRLALKSVDCQYVWLLNNDAVIAPDALKALLDAAEQHPEAGILGPKIYYHDRPDTFWYAGARRRRYVLAAADTGRGQVDRGQFESVREVDYVFGTAMLIRREVFEIVGSFDEQFFLYLEDLDQCLMAQQAGFRLLFAPKARIWHSVSASTRRDIGVRRYHMVKSTLLFLKKHTSESSFALVLLFWSLVYMQFLLVDLLRGQFSVLYYYSSGLFHGLREITEADTDLAACMREGHGEGNKTAVTSD